MGIDEKTRQRWQHIAIAFSIIFLLGVVASFVLNAWEYFEFFYLGQKVRAFSMIGGLASAFFLCWFARPGKRLADSAATGLAVLWILLFAGWFLAMVPVLGPHPKESAVAMTKENLSQLGKAMTAYSLDYDWYMPFDSRGPLHSLALLYPKYVEDPIVFKDPYVNRSWRLRKLGKPFPDDSTLADSICQFGYTWHISPDAKSNFVIMGSLPELITRPGCQVLFVDGAVRRVFTPLASANPEDNIFAPEPGWSADTDSWIRLE